MINAMLVQRVFPYYRNALFSELVRQQPPNPQVYLCFGTEKNTEKIGSFKNPVELPVVFYNRCSFVKNVYVLNLFLWQCGLVGKIVRCKHDAVIFEACPYYLSTWIGAIIAKFLGKRVLFWTHGVKRLEHGAKFWVRKVFYHLPDVLLVYGKRGKVLSVKAGIDSDRIHVINNSFDFENQEVVSFLNITKKDTDFCRLPFENNRLPILIWVGRLIRQRRLDMLIKSGKMLCEKGIPVNILLVGDGEELTALSNLVKEYDLEKHVCFYGACYDEKILGTLFMQASVLISPGPVGLSCIHAFAYGIPVITSDDFDNQGPEVEVIIPGVNGDFFLNNNQFDLTTTIEKWLLLVASSDVHKIKCQEQIKRYSPKVQSNLINRALEGMLPE